MKKNGQDEPESFNQGIIKVVGKEYQEENREKVPWGKGLCTCEPLG